MGEEVMEFIQALVILILAIGFNGGISGGLNGEILPPGATLIPSGQYKSAEEVFSGEDQYKAYSEDEDGTLIMNPMYRNAWGPSDDPINQVDPVENYFDNETQPENGGRWYWDEARQSWLQY